MSLVLRPMAEQDLDAVIWLASASGGAPQWSRATYQAIWAPSGAVLRFAFVAYDEQALGGFAVASWLPQEVQADVETLAVAPRCRRQGVASALLRACMAAAAQAGATGMRLEVRASNVAALALYRQNGFTSIGLRQAYYSAPVEDAVLLQAPLGSAQLHGPL